MSDFKEQQQDRAQEGKELKHEDEMKDLSQMSAKELPAGAEKTSIFRKLSEGISNAAHTFSDKVGLTEKPIEGHEDLDKKTIKQQKKVNAEVLKQNAEEGFEGNKGDVWMNRLPEDLKKEIESVKISKLLRHVPREGEEQNKSLFDKISGGITNLAQKVGLAEKPKEAFKGNDWEHELPKQAKKEAEGTEQQAENLANKASAKLDEAKEKKSATEASKPSFISNITEKVSQGVGAYKEKLNAQKEEKENNAQKESEEGTKVYRTVKDGFKEDADELKQEKRTEELGQEELASRNPFQTLGSGDNEENRTIGEKLSSTLGEATKKVKSTFSKDTTAVDKENAREVA